MKNHANKATPELNQIATQIIYDSEDIDDYAKLYETRDKIEVELKETIKTTSTIKNFHRPIWQIASALLAIVLLLGAGYGLVRNYIIEFSGNHNNFIAYEGVFFNLPSYIPSGYIAVNSDQVEQEKASQTIMFRNDETDTFISYTEANSKLTVSADGEDVSMEFVPIANRYEGTLINKEGRMILIWQQEGCFYLLITNDKNLSAESLIKIASSLKQ